MVDATFSLFSKLVLHFQRISPRSMQHLLQCKLHFQGLGRFHLCPEDFCFVSLQRHDFQALKEVEMLLDRRKLESLANAFRHSPFLL